MIRRRYQPQRSAASKPGLPELPGLASAIYRPEPRPQARIANGKGSASAASSSRCSRIRDDQQSARASEDVPMRVTEAGARRMHSHSLSASSSLPSFSVSFPPTTGSSSEFRFSERVSPSASLNSGLGSTLQLYERIRSSQSSTTRGAYQRRSDPLLGSGLPPNDTPSTLTKKQSAPDRLVNARARATTGHQVGSTSREVATRRSNGRERGPTLRAMIRTRLSRQSTPVLPATILGDDGDIEMLTETSWIRSPSWNGQRSRHDFRSPRTSPSPNGMKRGLPLPNAQTQHYGRLPQRSTSPRDVLMESYESSKAKMGIRNLLS